MDLVLRQDQGGVAWLTLNAPDRLNPLSMALLQHLLQELTAIAADPHLRVVVIGGAGRAFSAGHDLREMVAMRAGPDGGETALAALFALCTQVMLAIRDLPQPVIASVQGLAAAGAVNSSPPAIWRLRPMMHASACERREYRAVLFHADGGADARVVPRRRLSKLLTTGRLIPRTRRLRLGLINRAVPTTALEGATRELAQTLRKNCRPRSAVATGVP